MTEPVLYSEQELEGGVGLMGVLTINRVEKLNALNAEVLKMMSEFLRIVGRPEGPRVLIIRGAQAAEPKKRAFVAGADIGELVHKTPSDILSAEFSLPAVLNQIEGLPIPVIADIGGLCLGGGMELAMACDIRLATPNSHFGQPEVKIGVIAGAGAHQRLPWLVGGGRAAEMLLTGRFLFSAKWALTAGLINRIEQENRIEQAAQEMAAGMCELPRAALAATKAMLLAARDRPYAEAAALERQTFADLFGPGTDQERLMTAFLNKTK